MNEFQTLQEALAADPLRSRIRLNVTYDIIGHKILLPPGLRIIQVVSNDVTATVSLLVEAAGTQYKYPWRPGFEVPQMMVTENTDLLAQLRSK